MDPSFYRNFHTSRGFTYYYFYRPALSSSKPTLLFLHGFPSTSSDWTPIAAFFIDEGYGVLVPDLLGYGGTDKPTDPDAYRLKRMAKDVVEILDAEKLDKVVSISHDWGSGLNSRLAIYHPERFFAFAFFAVGYTPPSADFDIDIINSRSVENNGYAKFGYWKFFAKEGAENIILDHLESFFTILYSSDESLGKHWCPEGALEKWLLTDGKASKVILSEEDLRAYADIFSRGGFSGPLCWYKAMVNKLTPADDAEIPKTAYPISQPVFFGGCSRDPTSIPSEYIGLIKLLCPNHTINIFDSGHWVIHERATEVNEELKKWLSGLQLEDTKKSHL